MSREFKAANMVNHAILQLKELSATLTQIENEMDLEVREMSGPRNELEELLQTVEVDPGMANQLWARLGKFDRHNAQMYSRLQNAEERAIEMLAHLTKGNYHNAMCHEEADAFQSAATIIKAYSAPEDKDAE